MSKTLWNLEIHGREHIKMASEEVLTEEQERTAILLESLRTDPSAREEVDVLLAELPGVRKTRALKAGSKHWSIWPHVLQRKHARLEALSHLTR